MKIKTKGTPCLHIESRPIKDVNKKVLKLAQKMVNTMIKAKGVGIAAPQIGKNIQMCAIINHVDESIVFMINPKIVETYQGTSTQEEGCLSCPDETRHIERFDDIEVEYIGIDGEPKRERYTGIDARIVQHELDHLKGVLISDYE
jgi:peptide deformylase